MAELTIRPEEIRDALARFVQEYEPEGASREEIGTVIECGDGIARVEGLPSAMANELLEFENGVRGLALNLDVREIGVVILGEFNEIEEGQQVTPDRRDPVRAGRRRLPGPRGRAAGRAAGRQGPDRGHRAAPAGDAGALGGGAPAGEGAAADRHQGHRRDDRDRPGPAAADHRRPADRQDRHRHRRDHQPAGELGVGRPSPPGALHLRRGGPEGLDHRLGAPVAGGSRRAGVHHDRGRAGLGPGGLQVHRAVHRFGHRAALDVPGQARADHLRRPVQAGRGVPRDLAAAAPAAGPRGLPGRRVLPALPAARAVRQAVRRAGRRIADRAADHRDQGATTSPPTSRRTSSRSPTGRSSWRPTCSTRASGPPSTSAGRCRGSAATRRSRR